MIENKTIGIFNCVDDNSDEIRLTDSICFNTKVLNIKCFNTLDDDSIITEVILNKKEVLELCKCLKSWAMEG